MAVTRPRNSPRDKIIGAHHYREFVYPSLQLFGSLRVWRRVIGRSAAGRERYLASGESSWFGDLKFVLVVVSLSIGQKDLSVA